MTTVIRTQLYDRNHKNLQNWERGFQHMNDTREFLRTSWQKNIGFNTSLQYRLNCIVGAG